MRLVVVDDHTGTWAEVCASIEEYNLDKPMAAADVVGDIKTAVRSLRRGPGIARPVVEPREP